MTNQNTATPSRAFAARLRACRSFFLTPASHPDRFGAARAQGGDAIIVDLESTVSPGDKARARDAALAYLREPAEAGLIRILRINSPRTVEGLRDLLALCEHGGRPDAVIIPKCQSADEIRLVAEVLDGSQSAIAFVPMVELARAVFVAHLIADANERVCGLFLGGGDLAADLGAEGPGRICCSPDPASLPRRPPPPSPRSTCPTSRTMTRVSRPRRPRAASSG